MQSEIKTIVQDFFKNQKLDQIQETEKTLLKLLGKNFLEKNVKQIYRQHGKIIITTNSIEAKTELNLIKSKIKQTVEVVIK